MKKMYPKLIAMSFLVFKGYSQQVTPNFIAPDTVCTNQTFTVQNNSSGIINSHYWNFCQGNPLTPPLATNIGNPSNLLSSPVYYSLAKDGNDYYAFVCNNGPGTITRLFYGQSLNNTPTVTALGNLGVLGGSLEDLHLELENGVWYGIVVGGNPGSIYRLSFGASLSNAPTAINMGNIGGLNYPQRLQIFWSGGNCYGFTPNRNNSTITRFSFGSSISNTPVGLNLGNIGGLNVCDDLSIINYTGNWYAYIVNEGNSTLTRWDFGNSLLNIPTGTNLGNIGGLNLPRGIDVYVECNGIQGMIVNRQSNDILRLNFNAGPTGLISTTNLGNIANFSFPHSIERFRYSDTLYLIIPNVTNSTLSKLIYPPCNNASIPSSALQTPPGISYNQPGTYYISYIANEGQLSQAIICKKVVVTGPFVSVSGTTVLCSTDTLKLFGSGSANSGYSWVGPAGFVSSNQNVVISNLSTANSGTYSLTLLNSSGCAASQTIAVNVVNSPTLATQNHTVCYGTSVTLSVSGASSYSWSTGSTSPTIKVTPGKTMLFQVTGFHGEGCNSLANVEVKVINCTNIKNIQIAEMDITLFPNPSFGELHLYFLNDAEFLLTDQIGRTKATIKFTSIENEVILSDLDPGVYYLNGIGKFQGLNKKVVIIK